jgi:predicted nucleotidyltransferase
MPTDFLSIFHEFERRNIHYVLVGGLAVLLHGVDRLTADIDLVVDPAPDEAAKAIAALLEMGFKSHAPIEPRQFADGAVRERWRRGSGMLVLSFWDPENRRPTVDLFAEYPMDFAELFKESIVMPLTNTKVRMASLEHLIAIKRAAARPKDLEDVQRLLELRARPTQ